MSWSRGAENADLFHAVKVGKMYVMKYGWRSWGSYKKNEGPTMRVVGPSVNQP